MTVYYDVVKIAFNISCNQCFQTMITGLLCIDIYLLLYHKSTILLPALVVGASRIQPKYSLLL